MDLQGAIADLRRWAAKEHYSPEAKQKLLALAKGLQDFQKARASTRKGTDVQHNYTL